MSAQTDRIVHTESVVLVASQVFAQHITPAGHPERVDRATVMWKVARRWADAGGQLMSPLAVSDDVLERVHTRGHVEAVAATAGRTIGFDADTYTSGESAAVARLAVGATVAAVDHALTGGRGLAFVRPPGHHAERHRAMGFCLFNNAAVAVAHALGSGVDRVAIVDYDVHHGNGTQHIFYDDPRVLYVSLHQYPFYPGTGAADEVGAGAGVGSTVNVPLAAGAGDADYDTVFELVVEPVVSAWRPDLLVLSAGYDAHGYDPLGGMRLTTAGYTRLTQRVRRLADQCCAGRLATVTEGGYDLIALEECLRETLQVMALPAGQVDGMSPNGPTSRAEAAIHAVRDAQRAYWPTL